MNYVFMFPGQGSQKVGMGKDFYSRFPSVEKRFSEASSIIGRDVKRIIFEGPEEELRRTENTQPALFTVECSIVDVLQQEFGIRPMVTLGHSLGEYCGLYSAGFFSFEVGLCLVAKRGELMAQAGKATKGTMAAVMGLSKDKIVEILSTIRDGVVVCANENEPNQIVISGDERALEVASAALTAAGAKRVIKLAVSGAFHSPLMKPAAEAFETMLSPFAFNEPFCPIIANVTAQPVTDPAVAKGLLVKQLLSPVRWIDSIAYLKQMPTAVCLEIGPGVVLKGLAKKCSRDIDVISCESVDNLYSLPR
ncbi:MAG: ACP S-malonyltransferase [Chitinivibrionales bacterium]|nr:ACP S-malonyltransferase [Chitinivibrionales bacterium]